MEQVRTYDNYNLEAGDIVRFHTPYPDENPDTVFVVLKTYYAPQIPRAGVVKITASAAEPIEDKLFIKDLERVQQVTPTLLQNISKWMDRHLTCD
ncbi:hypothetical protein [Sphingobacterium suaedae]|uniref:Uncharacterized protein n=1 Tax=Sphingobacterium suaedae TaxID=1686402 RepID=A0ABW5KC48_9SPHI